MVFFITGKQKVLNVFKINLFCFNFKARFTNYKQYLMPKIHVQKSITINAPLEKVYDTIKDFHHWQAWSPWLLSEPEARVKVNEDGKYYEWEGNRVGAGNMTVLKEEKEQIDYDLTFLKPWKSEAKVKFNCKAKGNQTMVTWHMDSSLPFFMFWMKKSMTAFIGADYDRGLNMLKEYIEEGTVHSKLDFIGDTDFAGLTYIAIKRNTTMDQIGPAMENDFKKLGEYFETNNLEVAGQGFSIYHKWDMVKKQVSYTIGLPIDTIPNDLPSTFTAGHIPKTKTYKLRHTGSYKHLGNAWSTMYNMHRNKEIKPIKKIHPFEVYVNHPGEVKEEELITDVYFAVK